MVSDITSAAMQKLIGVGKIALNDLAKRGILVRGEKRGCYAVEASVSGYSSTSAIWPLAGVVRPGRRCGSV